MFRLEVSVYLNTSLHTIENVLSREAFEAVGIRNLWIHSQLLVNFKASLSLYSRGSSLSSFQAP